MHQWKTAAGWIVAATGLPENFQTLETEAEFFIRYTHNLHLQTAVLTWEENL